MRCATERERRLLGALADLLGYPGPTTAGKARACARAVGAMLRSPLAEKTLRAEAQPDEAAPERAGGSGGRELASRSRRERVSPRYVGATERLERFARACGASPPARLEELYTSAFDLGPLCVPYIGHHLFGEGRERAMFLARLRAMQREEGFVPGVELPDHVCEVLRFLAAARDTADRDALVDGGLAPAAEKMLAALTEARHPWADVMGALCEVVRRRVATAAAVAACGEVTP